MQNKHYLIKIGSEMAEISINISDLNKSEPHIYSMNAFKKLKNPYSFSKCSKEVFKKLVISLFTKMIQSLLKLNITCIILYEKT